MLSDAYADAIPLPSFPLLEQLPSEYLILLKAFSSVSKALDPVGVVRLSRETKQEWDALEQVSVGSCQLVCLVMLIEINRISRSYITGPGAERLTWFCCLSVGPLSDVNTRVKDTEWL